MKLDFDITIIGNGSASPHKTRYPAAQYLSTEGHHWLVDCGEGTQFRLMRMGLKRSKLEGIVITHMHGDHTAGNAAMAALGATVIGQENIYPRLEALTPENLPTLTYSDSITLHLNGEEVWIFWPQSAHTDHDTMIYLKNANILHVGDVPSNLRYPNIGIDDGGSVEGMTRAARLVLDMTNAETRIMAGHLGPLVPREEMLAQLEMFAEVSQRIQAMIDRGMSLEEVLAARPTADFDEARAAGAITPERPAWASGRKFSESTPLSCLKFSTSSQGVRDDHADQHGVGSVR